MRCKNCQFFMIFIDRPLHRHKHTHLLCMGSTRYAYIHSILNKHHYYPLLFRVFLFLNFSPRFMPLCISLSLSLPLSPFFRWHVNEICIEMWANDIRSRVYRMLFRNFTIAAHTEVIQGTWHRIVFELICSACNIMILFSFLFRMWQWIGLYCMAGLWLYT